MLAAVPSSALVASIEESDTPRTTSSSTATADPLPISPISANNQPPVATYEVEVNPDILAATPDIAFHWTHTPDPHEPNCTNFTAAGPQAFWSHADSDGCTHPGVEHEGLITVTATDGTIDQNGVASDGTWVCGAQYPHGSRTGVGSPPECIFEDVDITPEEPDLGICEILEVKGWLAPTQAVWQDDERFPPQGTKQLSYISDTTAYAELPMVAGKPTVVVGVREHWNNPPPLDSRDKIVILGLTTGTTAVPARMRLRSEGVATDPALDHTENVDPQPFGGPCGEPRGFRAEIEATQGVPGSAFSFAEAGSYSLITELVSPDGTPYGASAEVTGDVVETVSPNIVFTPVALSASERPHAGALVAAARAADQAAKTFIPDYWPLKPGSLQSRPFVALSDLSLQAEDLRNDWMEWALSHTEGDPTLAEELLDREATSAMLTHFFSHGNERTVAILTDDEFSRMRPPRTVDEQVFNTLGVALSQNVIALRRSWAHVHRLIAHELAHTMPYLWSQDEMLPQCKVAHWHNLPADNAFGLQITSGGAESRRGPIDGELSYMSSVGQSGWTDQCVYWNLLKEMSSGAQAAAHTTGAAEGAAHAGDSLFVQGRLAKISGEYVGELLPAYTTEEPLTLPATGGGGELEIVLRDTTGAELARHEFDPEFRLVASDEDHQHADEERVMIHFFHRIPHSPGAVSIELAGPDGVLDEQTVGPGAPQASILSPAPGRVVNAANPLAVGWEGSDPDGDDLSYTLLHSTDGGDNWHPVLVESTATSHELEINTGHDQRLRLIATDGLNSSQAEIGFSAPPRARVSSRVKLNYAPKAQRFKVTVRAARPACARSRVVRLFRQENGRKTRQAQARTNNKGAFQFKKRFRNPKGRFFVEATRKAFTAGDGTIVTCPLARSNNVRR